MLLFRFPSERLIHSLIVIPIPAHAGIQSFQYLDAGYRTKSGTGFAGMTNRDSRYYLCYECNSAFVKSNEPAPADQYRQELLHFGY